MRRLLVFVLFLFVYLIWLWGGSKLTKLSQAGVRSNKYFLTTEAMFFYGNAFFWGSLYLLAGVWNLKLVALFLAFGQVAILVSSALVALLRKPNENGELRMTWGTTELGISHKYMTGAILLSTVLWAVVLVPLLLGIAYFKYPPHSHELSILVIRLLLVNSFYSYLTMDLLFINLLSSASLDDGTRRSLFIGIFTGLIPTSLLLALAFWAFGIGDHGPHLPLSFGSLSLNFSLQMFVLLVSFFLVTALLPYVIGTQRSKWLQITYLEKRAAYCESLSDILSRPVPGVYISSLNDLQHSLEEAEAELWRENPGLAELRSWQQNPASLGPEQQPIVFAMSKTADLDSRIEFSKKLALIRQDVAQIVLDLQTRLQTSADSAVTVAGLWAAKFEKIKAELVQRVDAIKKTSPAPVIAITTVGSMLLSGFLGEAVKAIWHLLSGSLPQAK
jgi:hypothetical protein